MECSKCKIGEKIKDGRMFCEWMNDFVYTLTRVLLNWCGHIKRQLVFSNWSDIPSESSYFIIHKACIAPQNQSTYYVFIKRKHISTLIFKWIFKRNTQSHPLSKCSLQLTFRLARDIQHMLTLSAFLTLSSIRSTSDTTTHKIRFGLTYEM